MKITVWNKKICAGSVGAVLLLVICIAFIFVVYLEPEVNPDLQVIVKQGTLLGHHLTSRKGRRILAFERIPYAKPPVGELRFRSPQPAAKWHGVLDATQSVPKCVQRNVFLLETEVSGDEDCLYINVYTPHVKLHHLMDVMVYVHGGGWISGEGNAHKPNYLLDEDVVLVTFNYRLGPLGFLSTGDHVCPGNNGLKDQVAALRWVRDNIAAFGGNPGSVTIFGESAGGASVHYHLLSPASKGLFHRAISQSGTVLCPWAFAPDGSSINQTKKLANLLNCSTKSSSEILSCLRQKDAVEIVATDKDFMEWDVDPMIPFKPVIETEGDDVFLPSNPEELINNSNDVPWIAGINSAEGALCAARLYGSNEISDMDARFEHVAPITLFYNEASSSNETSKLIRNFYFGNGSINHYTVDSVVNMYTDRWFLTGTDEAVSLQVQSGSQPVFYYYFTYRGSTSFSSIYGGGTRNYGVSHGDDLIYLFPMESILGNSETTEDDEKMVDILTKLWANFARTGNPTPKPFHGVNWLRVSPTHKNYLEIGQNGLALKQDLLKARVDFWKMLFPKKG